MADLTVTLAPPPGMIALKGDLSDPALREAVAQEALGVPDRLTIRGGIEQGAAWMAPDELLLFVPRGDATAVMARLSERLAEAHHLLADVSDLRVAIRLEGAAREVLGKLTPADLHPDAFSERAFRRSRLGQVAAAFWLDGSGATVLCFRSVADDLLALLRQSASDGPVGYFAAH